MPHSVYPLPVVSRRGATSHMRNRSAMSPDHIGSASRGAETARCTLHSFVDVAAFENHSIGDEEWKR